MLASVRDIAIVIVAAESILLLAMLLVIVWYIFRLVRLFKSKAEEFSEIGKTLLQSAKQTADTAGETATTVKGSAEFLSDTVVSPVVQMVSAVAGARSFVGALFALPRSRKNGGRS